MTPTDHPSAPTLRVAISDAIDSRFLTGIPKAVEVVRYSVSNTEPIEVDLLVPPGFSKNAAEILTRIRARYVQTISAGVETIQPVLPAGTVLCNARGVHDSATAEWAVTAALAMLKWLPFYDELRRRGRWITPEDGEAFWLDTYGSPHGSSSPVLLEELAGKTVLIVGYGAIGKAIEARLLPFEPGRILRIARTARDTQPPVDGIGDLHRLLPEADIVVLITPLTPETHHLIGAPELAQMRRGTLLVNAARGAVVDTDALVEALEKRHVRAALDVTDPEPLPPDHPLWQAPGLLLTPHIAGSSASFLQRVFDFVGQQLQRLLDGKEPLNIIEGHY